MPADQTWMPPPAHTTRVVVVEDEQSISDPLRSALEREGYGVEVAATGAAALEAVRREEPDVVLLDLMLPDMDGRDVCRTIRSSSRVPIIMLTARGLETDRVVGLELGADDYLVKPFGMVRCLIAVPPLARCTPSQTIVATGFFPRIGVPPDPGCGDAAAAVVNPGRPRWLLRSARRRRARPR